MTDFILIKLILFVFSLGLVAFFSAAETALTSLSTISLASLKELHPACKHCVVFWEEKPNEVLTSIIVGSTLALIGNGVVVTSFALDVAAFSALPRFVVLAAVPFIGALLLLSVGEILPKTVSRYQPERAAILLLPMLLRFNRFIRPVTRFMLRISERLISVFDKHTAKEIPFLQQEELRVLLLSDETLPLTVPSRRLLENILDFGDTRISQVMVPRTEIQAVNLEQGKEKIIDQMAEKGYSRVPVYRGNLDNIVGIIYSKDLTLALRGGSLFVIDDLIRPAYFVPASARIDQVLREFKTGHQHMALVVDEFGSTIGLATIEDLVEELVGEIWDEYDIKEKTIIPFPDGSYLIWSNESLEHINEELAVHLPAEEFNTLSGWVLDLFGRIPRIGETIRWGDMEIEVIDADKRHVQRVKIKKIKA